MIPEITTVSKPKSRPPSAPVRVAFIKLRFGRIVLSPLNCSLEIHIILQTAPGRCKPRLAQMRPGSRLVTIAARAAPAVSGPFNFFDKDHSPMTLRFFFSTTPVWSARTAARVLLLAIVTCAALTGTAQTNPAPKPDPDVLVLSNGDTLHGKFVGSIQGKLTFHSDPLGDVSIGWDKVKELHSTQRLAVLEKNLKPTGRGR